MYQEQFVTIHDDLCDLQDSLEAVSKLLSCDCMRSKELIPGVLHTIDMGIEKAKDSLFSLARLVEKGIVPVKE